MFESQDNEATRTVFNNSIISKMGELSSGKDGDLSKVI